jgi:hypothetical protein
LFRHWFVVFSVLLTSCTAGPGSAPGSSFSPSGPPVIASASASGSGSGSRLPDFSHVVVLVMENREYGQIIGNPEAPYINSLAKHEGLAVEFYGEAHPSLANYLALLAGSTFGVKQNCTDCHWNVTNFVDQLANHSLSWKAYMEDMPSPCYTGASYKGYAKKHNPFMYFDDIVGNSDRCNRVVPFTQLSTDLEKGLPKFVWITPNLCHDMHDCDTATGDTFLSGLVPKILTAMEPNGVLFLTWDEGTSDEGCCTNAHGGHIVTIVAGHRPAQGRDSTRYTHYSILRTIEHAWGLQFLGNAHCDCTREMTSFF